MDEKSCSRGSDFISDSNRRVPYIMQSAVKVAVKVDEMAGLVPWTDRKTHRLRIGEPEGEVTENVADCRVCATGD